LGTSRRCWTLSTRNHGSPLNRPRRDAGPAYRDFAKNTSTGLIEPDGVGHARVVPALISSNGDAGVLTATAVELLRKWHGGGLSVRHPGIAGASTLLRRFCHYDSAFSLHIPGYVPGVC